MRRVIAHRSIRAALCPALSNCCPWRGFAKATAKAGGKSAKTGSKKAKGGRPAEVEADNSSLFESAAGELDHKQFDKFLNAANEASRTKLDWSEDEEKEHTRIATTYSINCFVRHQRLQKDLADKIWLTGEATAALPLELQAAATSIDTGCPPPDRPWPTWSTPPIKGFDPSPFQAVDHDGGDDDEKLLS